VWGWQGGRTALGSGLVYDSGGPDEREIGVMRSGVAAKRGAVIRFWEGGGGGWEDPATRPVEWVLDDVIDGLVSIDAARDLYGVAVRAVDEDAAIYEVDEEETARLRDARDTS
jgi:N-methylhydantoinase B